MRLMTPTAKDKTQHNMKNCLKDKTVVITGASSGIGEAMAEVYASMGAKVVLGARHADKLEALCRRIEQRGGKAAWCVTDVTRKEDCMRLIDTAVEHFGGIDDCTKYALPYLQRSHGSLVGISSVAGIHGLPGRTGYSASKFAMTGFLETIRIENLKKGLHVMVACPGFTASNVRFSALTADGSQQGATPRKEEKMMTAEEVARIVARGIARRKRLCLMEIEGRATNFVKKFAPGLVDRLFYYVMSKEPDSPFK